VKARRLTVPAALLAAAVAGALVALAVRGGAAAPATSPPPATSTATVVRTDLATSVLTAGTLGYAPTDPVVDQLPGTYTWLPAAGTAVVPGDPLYRVDNQPVVLMTGTTPAWRDFTPGMTDGPDVAELQSDLLTLGFARGLSTTADGHYGGLTVAAVERWQTANGYQANGTIPLGVVVFLPGAVEVGAESVAPGDAATPGASPFADSTTVRTVTVPLNPDLPTVSVGQTVSILLPSGASTPGRAAAVGPPPPGTTSGGSSSSAVTTELTVVPDHPAATGSQSDVPVQVALTTAAVRQVLAVPVTALLALAGGGYGVEVVEPSGTRHLVGVTTGLFAGGRVEVHGAGISAGTKVVVAQ